MLGRLRGSAGDVLRPAVLVPAGLVLALVLLLVAGVALADRAGATGRAPVTDTGPALVGVDLPADGSAGPPTVVLSPAASADPRAGLVRDLVTRTVDARNRGDLAAYRATLVPGTRVDADAFATVARTQRVGSAIVRRIDPVGRDELVVPLGFVTTQDPAVAPPDVRVPRLCWQISAVVEDTGSDTGLRLTEPRTGSQLRAPC